MTLALEILFALSVAADTILTYKVIASGKGVEIGPVARAYIESYYATFFVTVIAISVLIGWLRLVGKWWIVAPAYLAIYWRLGYLIRKHIRILHGQI